MSALRTPKAVAPDPFMSSSEFELNNLIRGKTRTAWEYYRRWLARYREDNPTDERGDWSLLGEFEVWAMRRAGKTLLAEPAKQGTCLALISSPDQPGYVSQPATKWAEWTDNDTWGIGPNAETIRVAEAS